jgi:hypothetical protein
MSQDFGCKYKNKNQCEDILQMNNEGTSTKRLDDLRDQHEELCKTPSHQGCSIYKELELQKEELKPYIEMTRQWGITG